MKNIISIDVLVTKVIKEIVTFMIIFVLVAFAMSVIAVVSSFIGDFMMVDPLKVMGLVVLIIFYVSMD